MTIVKLWNPLIFRGEKESNKLQSSLTLETIWPMIELTLGVKDLSSRSAYGLRPQKILVELWIRNEQLSPAGWDCS